MCVYVCACVTMCTGAVPEVPIPIRCRTGAIEMCVTHVRYKFRTAENDSNVAFQDKKHIHAHIMCAHSDFCRSRASRL